MNTYTEQEHKKSMDDFHNLMLEENEARQKQIKETLELVKPLVSENYFKAIAKWIKDEGNGIWGKLEIVTEPKGEYQKEANGYANDYWNELKGMWVDQYTGICGDDYSGYLTVKINDTSYLQACFEL